eukprot:3021895-Amphidinium_carterae.3
MFDSVCTKAKLTQETKCALSLKAHSLCALICKGDGIDSLIGCQMAPKDATSITVCGCGVK